MGSRGKSATVSNIPGREIGGSLAKSCTRRVTWIEARPHEAGVSELNSKFNSSKKAYILEVVLKWHQEWGILYRLAIQKQQRPGGDNLLKELQVEALLLTGSGV